MIRQPNLRLASPAASNLRLTTLSPVAVLLFLFCVSALAQQAPASYRIAGVVVDAASGSPVPRAEVSISTGSDEQDMTTDSSGRFSFDAVEPGKRYSLSATAPGYVNEQFNQHWAFSTAIVAGPGLDSEHIIFRLHPQAVIYGTVTDDRGDPVRNAQVILFRIQPAAASTKPTLSTQQQTNDIGEFRLAHLLPGKYYVAVQAQPWYAMPGFTYQSDSRIVHFGDPAVPKLNPALDVVYPVTFYPGVTDEHSAVQLNLSAGEKREADIQVSAVPAVHVRLTNLPGEGSAVFGAHQMVFGSWDATPPAVFQPISPGEYEIAGLPPGKLSLDIASGNEPNASRRSIQANFANLDVLDAASSGVGANVTGRVIFGTPISSATRCNVILATASGANFGAEPKKDGSFSFGSVPLGTYNVSAFLDGFGGDPADEYIQRISATGATASGHEITIEGSSDVQLTITMGHGFGKITGVALLDAKPFVGAMVLLVPASGPNLDDDSRMDQTDSDGSFILRSIVPGRYFLIAIDDGWDLEWRNDAVLKPYRDDAQIIQVAPGDNQRLTLNVQHKRND